MKIFVLFPECTPPPSSQSPIICCFKSGYFGNSLVACIQMLPVSFFMIQGGMGDIDHTCKSGDTAFCVFLSVLRHKKSLLLDMLVTPSFVLCRTHNTRNCWEALLSIEWHLLLGKGNYWRVHSDG